MPDAQPSPQSRVARSEERISEQRWINIVNQLIHEFLYLSKRNSASDSRSVDCWTFTKLEMHATAPTPTKLPCLCMKNRVTGPKLSSTINNFFELSVMLLSLLISRSLLSHSEGRKSSRVARVGNARRIMCYVTDASPF